MRGLVFLLSFAAVMAALLLFTEATIAFALFISATVAAIVCTVATRSGRESGRRILRNSRRGWGSTAA